jgi:hypothetical protein
VNGNLSPTQFGATPALPSSMGVEPRRRPTGSGPLSYTAHTNTSALQAAAWRKPEGVQSYTSATSGSIFKPFG